MEYRYDEATLDLLRLTIPTHGILVPVILRSGTNDLIDGRHRMKVRDELAADGISVTLPVHHVDTENPEEIDAIINNCRRPYGNRRERQQLVSKLKAKGHSTRAISDALGVGHNTVKRDLGFSNSAGVPNGTPAGPKAKTSGKDGKTYNPPADLEEIAEAWAMKDSGKSVAKISKEIGRPERTVRDWLKKARPVATAIGQPAITPPADPAPSTSAPTTPEPAAAAPTATTSQDKPANIPHHLKQAHQREQRRIRERWQPIAEHLRAAHDLIRIEKDRLCKEYAGAQGSLNMQRRWQAMADIWAENGQLSQFAEITGEPKAVTLDGLLSELERSSRMANGWIKSMATYTGCKPDPTRYQPE